MTKLFYILIEDDIPIGVAAEDREGAAREWSYVDADRRKLMIVEELR